MCEIPKKQIKMTGNNMIDGDDGSHPFSPKYVEKRQLITLVHCPACDCYFDEDGDEVDINRYQESEWLITFIEKLCFECYSSHLDEMMEEN